MLASDHVVLVLQAGCGVIYRGQGHRFGVDASVCRLMGSDFRVYAILGISRLIGYVWSWRMHEPEPNY
jgi:phage shock protein PspC (stress-responsive transcriptional regulator)